MMETHTHRHILKTAENWLVKAAGQGFDKATQELEKIVGEEE